MKKIKKLYQHILKFIKKINWGLVVGIIIAFLFGLLFIFSINLFVGNFVLQALSFIIIYVVMILVFLVYFYKLQPDKLKHQSQIIKRYLSKDIEKTQDNQYSLFTKTIRLFFQILLWFSFALLAAWIGYYAGKIGMGIFILLCFLVSLWILHGENGGFVWHIIVLPLIIYHYFWGSYYLAGIVAGFLYGLFFYVNAENKLRTKKKENAITKQVGLVRIIKEIAQLVRENVYNNKSLVEYQSVIISIIIFIFIVGSYIQYLFPPSLRESLESSVDYINNVKQFIPYIAFGFYIIINIGSVLEFLVKPILSKGKSNWQIGGDLLLIIIITIIVIPILSMPAIVLSTSIPIMGHTLLGLDFAIIIGFFVFPIWIFTIYSYIIGLTLFLYPEEILLRYINFKNNNIN